MVVSLEGEYAPGLQAGAGPVELTIPRQPARARRELTNTFEIERPKSGLCAFENPVHEVCDAPIHSSKVLPVGHQTTSHRPLFLIKHARQPLLYREFDDLQRAPPSRSHRRRPLASWWKCIGPLAPTSNKLAALRNHCRDGSAT